MKDVLDISIPTKGFHELSSNRGPYVCFWGALLYIFRRKFTRNYIKVVAGGRCPPDPLQGGSEPMDPLYPLPDAPQVAPIFHFRLVLHVFCQN